MKPRYRKTTHRRPKNEGDWYYDDVRGGYYRRIRTIQELRRNCGDAVDFRDEPHVEIKSGRGRTHTMLDAWNDFPVSRRGGRSWKDYTRHKKQWMVGADPKPSIPSPRRGWGMLVWLGHEHYDH